MSLNFLRLCHAQTCGKCVPCRVGLSQLADLIEQVLDRTATKETIDLIEATARVIADSADCAIGYEAAHMVLRGVRGFREDFEEHAFHGRCICALSHPVPCVSVCPAHVDVPGYVALVREGRYSDAVRLIRKDNPFPSACAYVCEHPCEAQCRRPHGGRRSEYLRAEALCRGPRGGCPRARKRPRRRARRWPSSAAAPAV